MSDLSVFYMTTGDDVLAWVHDIDTGQPVGGAEISFEGDIEAAGRTDKQGVAQIRGAKITKRSDEETRDYRVVVSTRFVVKVGERVFVADDSYYYYDHSYWNYRYASGARKLYMSYVYTDRSIYHTTDKIHVWGVVRPRDFATPLPQGLELRLSESGVSQPVTLQPDGTFTAVIELKNQKATWDYLQLLTADGQGMQ